MPPITSSSELPRLAALWGRHMLEVHEQYGAHPGTVKVQVGKRQEVTLKDLELALLSYLSDASCDSLGVLTIQGEVPVVDQADFAPALLAAEAVLALVRERDPGAQYRSPEQIFRSAPSLTDHPAGNLVLLQNLARVRRDLALLATADRLRSPHANPFIVPDDRTPIAEGRSSIARSLWSQEFAKLIMKATTVPGTTLRFGSKGYRIDAFDEARQEVTLSAAKVGGYGEPRVVDRNRAWGDLHSSWARDASRGTHALIELGPVVLPTASPRPRVQRPGTLPGL